MALSKQNDFEEVIVGPRESAVLIPPGTADTKGLFVVKSQYSYIICGK